MKSRKFGANLIVVATILIALLPFARLIWGVDFTDTGYSISNFCSFSDSRATWSLSTYFSNLTGFVFLHMPFGSTYIGIRFYCTIIVSLTLALLFTGLKKYFNAAIIFVGLAVSLFVTWCPFVVLYNYLTYLITAIVLMLICKGFDEEKRRFFLMAGIALGFGVFTRFSNLTLCILIIPMIYYGILNGRKASEIVKDSLYAIGGFVSGFVFVWIISLFTHGPGAMRDMLKSLSDLSGADYGYSYRDMLLTLPNAIAENGKWVALTGAILLLATGLSAVKCNSGLRKGSVLGAAAVLTVAFVYILRKMSYWSVFTLHDYTSYLSVSFFVLILVLAALVISVVTLFLLKRDKTDKFWAMVTLCLIVVIPLGTNTGMLAYQNNMFVILPVMLGIAGKMLGVTVKIPERTKTGEGQTKVYKQYNKYGIVIISVLLMAATLFQSVRFYTSFCYGSAGNRELSAHISKGSLKGTRVLPGMVGIVEGLTDYFEANVDKQAAVISWGDIPLTGFMVDRKTAFSTGWPDLVSFPYSTFEAELNAMDRPVIVVNRWYSGGDLLNPEVWEFSDKAALLSSFMDEKGYEMTYENDKYRVYTAY